MALVRWIGVRVAAFLLGALVAAAYFPLIILATNIHEDLWPAALTIEVVLFFGAMIWIRELNLSYVWPALGLPVGFVGAWIVTIIILVSIYGWSGD